jgi:hypothetical protein
MQVLKIDQRADRAHLKSTRNLVFAEFSRNPANTELAIQIRAIDDRISQLAEHSVSKTGQPCTKTNPPD